VPTLSREGSKHLRQGRRPDFRGLRVGTPVTVAGLCRTLTGFATQTARYVVAASIAAGGCASTTPIGELRRPHRSHGGRAGIGDHRHFVGITSVGAVRALTAAPVQPTWWRITTPARLRAPPRRSFHCTATSTATSAGLIVPARVTTRRHGARCDPHFPEAAEHRSGGACSCRLPAVTVPQSLASKPGDDPDTRVPGQAKEWHDADR